MEAAHLHLVDAETGEIVGDRCPQCHALEDQLAGAEKEIRAWRARYQQLKRDKDAEARSHQLWPDAVRLFGEWKDRCRHPRSEFDADRFFLCEPFLRRHGFDLCLRAVEGAAFDPWTKRQRNGSVKRFDGWDLLFRDADHFEGFVNRAPR